MNDIDVSIQENNTIKAIINGDTIYLKYELNPLCPHITQCYKCGQEFGGINSKIYDYHNNQLLAVIYCDSSIDEDILVYNPISEKYKFIPHIITELGFLDEYEPYFHVNIDFEYDNNNKFHYDLFNNKLK